MQTQTEPEGAEGLGENTVNDDSQTQNLHLTFSQREGKVPLAEPMQLEFLPRKFRQRLDYVLHVFLYNDRVKMRHILRDFQLKVQNKFVNEIDMDEPENDILDLIREGEYHEVLTLVECIVRSDKCFDTLRNGILLIFDEVKIAYSLIKIDDVFTVVPLQTKEIANAIQHSLDVLTEADMHGSSTHLQQAIKHINAGQYADSISDSINAVESVARRIVPGTNSLGNALKSLEKKNLLTNQQLKAGFTKIYSYTNTEEGIRHAQVFKDSSAVGIDEAIFMFGACAAFAAFLVAKYSKSQEMGED